MGYQPFRPDLTFAEQVDASFAQVAAQLSEAGHRLADAEVNMVVTGRTDSEVAFIQRRAAEIGFGKMRFVDDHTPARPGTVTTASLDPLASSLVTDARARRILGDQS